MGKLGHAVEQTALAGSGCLRWTPSGCSHSPNKGMAAVGFVVDFN
jgi:hypothetical protein